MRTDNRHTSNLILDALSTTERQAFQSILQPFELTQGQTLFRPGEPITRLYLPLDAIVSLVIALSTGEVVESAMIGRDGVVGTGAIVSGASLSHAVVRMSGNSLSCEAQHLKPLLARHPRIAELLIIHEQVVLAQAQQSAACNAVHSIESRLARILLRARDLRGSDLLDITQEQLAEMLGVRRTSVSIIAHTLQAARMIEYKRGRIGLVNIDGLKEASCECYAAVKGMYAKLLSH